MAIGFLKKCKRLLRRLRDVVFYLIRRLRIDIISVCHRKYPLEDKIVFANFNGRGFGDNPKYIAEELLRQKAPYDMVWLVNDMDEAMPEGIRKVPFHGRQSYYELATAKVIINNVKGDLNLRRRKGQYYIQTWHAGYGFKFVEKDAADKLPADYIIESKINSRDTDLILSGSKLQSDEYRSSFWCTCEILEKGLPRNDPYFAKTPEQLRQVRQSLGIPEDTKVILYAPTFRTAEDTLQTYGLDLERTVSTFQDCWGGDWVLLFRHHPNLTFALETDGRGSVLDVSSYPDMQELVLIADVVISDYSTSALDAAFLNKTVFIFTPDLEEYQQLRGLKPYFYQMTFPRANTNEELEAQIARFDRGEYQAALQTFWDSYQPFEDGHASEAVAERIHQWMHKPLV